MTPETIDPTGCPLCGQPNRCALERERASGVAQPPCWCAALTFDDALQARLPLAARGTACICRTCAEGARAEAAP